MLNWIEVDSSMISAFAYDEAHSILTLKFRETPSVYEYYGVPKSLVFQLQDAPSKGRFILAYVTNKYFYKRLS